ncbi:MULTISPECIES: hypothetical protein [unclassified Isoptericola]|uniref:hypothetical protein n=1 Tax=unclassified Isoptericola TaxID=2623355 RepID=UPI003669A2FE
MRVVGRVLLAVVGGLVLVVGAAAAWVVGPDDTVVAGDTTFSTGTAYTARGLLDVENLAVRVTAEARKGEVFVGVGHPVDVSDVVADHDAFRIFQVNIGSLAGAVDPGEDAMPDPRGIDWFDSVSGAGEQALSYPVDGLAPQFLIYSPDGAPVTASIGFTVPGAFRFLLLVAGAGALLAAASFLLRRRRPRGSGGADDVVDPTDAEPASDDAEEPRERAATGTTTRRVAAVVGAGALVLPLGACAVVPTLPAEMPARQERKVALTADDVDALWAGYDKRNNAAIKAAAAPKYDSSRWSTADTGVALEGDLYWTRYNQAASKEEGAKKAKGDVERLTTTGEWVSSPSFDSYPMWAVVHGETTSSADEKKDAKDDTAKEKEPKFTTASLVVKVAADQPWKVRSGISVPVSEVENFPEAATDPTEAQLAKAQKVAKAMNAYVSTGKKSKLLGDLAGVKALRELYVGRIEEGMADDDSPSTWSLDSELFDDESVHVVPADGGAYAVIDQRHTQKVQHDDAGWHWNPPFDAVNGDAGALLYQQQASTVLVWIPDSGKVKTFPYYTRPVIADSM